MGKSGVMMMVIYIVVVGVVFVPSPTFAISSSDQDRIVMNGQDRKMVSIMDRDTLFEVLLKERLSQDNQCLGRGCAPWSPCQPGCHCVGPTGPSTIGICI
ncbi:hypothetical protein CsatB_002186 [Cannabis sativa]